MSTLDVIFFGLILISITYLFPGADEAMKAKYLNFDIQSSNAS